MALMGATELSRRIGGVVNAVTLRRWAAQGLIDNSFVLPTGRVVFSEAAVSEILKPAKLALARSRSRAAFDDVPLPGFEGEV